ncbi:hypothetical protein A3Q56_08596 [Intoshia linei]|uniref:Integrase catalytic domain-containing protein n=1 Tax=Intoshia linei TaxID=1819745 RepID=A0A177ANV1_9BILA|nr:hypothetical protein A3Q56_08596 [Intoshia linei]
MSEPYKRAQIGLIERSNRTVREKLRVLCNKNFDNWDTHLSSILANLRFCPTEKNKLSPLELVYGFNAFLPQRKKSNSNNLKQFIFKAKNYRKSYLKRMARNYNKTSKYTNHDKLYTPNNPISSKEQNLFKIKS